MSVLALALALGTTACGGGDGKVSDKQAQKALDHAMTSDVPACSEVWQVGKTLDLEKYDGCMNGDTEEAAMSSGCYGNGNKYLGQMASYQDKFYVLQTGTDPKTGEGGTPGKVTTTNPCS